MAEAETPSPEERSPADTTDAQPRRAGVRRTWIPLAALAATAVGMVAAQVLLAERIDSGGRLMITFLIAVAGSLVVAAWFFFGSGLSWRARAAGGLLLVGAALFVVLGVRDVEFSGDMVPTFVFRWSPDRHAVLEAHRAQQGDAELPAITTQVGPDDVLEYRGPRRDGIVPGPPLARDWSAEPPKLMWRQPVGGGYAPFVVVGPTLTTIEQRRDKEAIVAYDAETGRERWAYAYPALFSETLGGDGPRATSMFHDGKLYSLGATGVLSCVDFTTGDELWRINILKTNENGNLEWGMSGSPLVYENVVLVNPGNQKGTTASQSIVAYDQVDGRPRWGGGARRASYASPMLVTLSGVRQLLIFDAAGLAGFDAVDGSELWQFPWKSDFDINAAQPFVVDGNRVLISSATGAALLEISLGDGTWSVDEIWRNRKLKATYASPIVYQDHVYGIDENILVCLELGTGKQLWKDRAGQFGHGQILLRDDLLLVLGEAGELALVLATPERYTELGRIQAIEGKTWNVPVLVGNRIYVRNHLEMAAYDLPEAKPQEETPQQQESASEADKTVEP